VGISYLADENPGLAATGTILDLYILPLQKAALEDNVFLQTALWPDFAGNTTVLRLNSVLPIAYEHTRLVAAP